MPYFLRSLGLALITVSTIAGPAHAGQIKPFERQAFTTAQQNGKRVMIIVSSPMNPLSEEQKPILDRISRDFLYPDVLFFNVDFNRMKDVLRDLRVFEDATFVVYKGQTERARTTGEVNEMELRRMLDSAR